MKLTLQQITLLEASARLMVHDANGKAIRAGQAGQTESQQFWLAEAECARRLVALLKPGPIVTLESVQLTPAAEPCGDIHCDSVSCQPIG